MLNRVIILGAGGSGKTTLGKKIAQVLRAERKSIDDLRYSRDFKTKFSDKKATNNLRRFLKRKKWILDGVYAENFILPAFQRADTIIVIKSKRLKLIYRILKREIMQRKSKSLSSILKLLYWSQKYKVHNESKYLPIAKKSRKNVIILKNNLDIEMFIRSL